MTAKNNYKEQFTAYRIDNSKLGNLITIDIFDMLTVLAYQGIKLNTSITKIKTQMDIFNLFLKQDVKNSLSKTNIITKRLFNL